MVGRRGFTIAEILFMIFIVAVPLAGLVATQYFIYSASRKAEDRYKASAIAASLLEEADLESYECFTDSLARAKRSVPGIERYQYETEELERTENLVKVRAKIFWQDAQGEHTFSLTTSIARRPQYDN